MSVRRFLLYLYFLGYGIPVFAQPAVQADSLFLALEKLPERDRVEQANAQFYKLFSADFAKAAALGEKVLAICRKAGWKDQEALTLKNLGVVNYLQGNYEQALEYCQTALTIYEQLGDAAGQGAVYNELANFSKKRKEFDRVFEYLDRVLTNCVQPPETAFVCPLRWTIGAWLCWSRGNLRLPILCSGRFCCCGKRCATAWD